MIVAGDVVVFKDEKTMIARVLDLNKRTDAMCIPGASVMDGENQFLVGLPWCEDSCRMLQNIGVDAAPASPLYLADEVPLIEGEYTPMKHQLFSAAFMTFNPRCYVLNDPRTGKTGAVLLGVEYMQRKGIITGGCLIITTVTTLRSVWAKSIMKTFPHVVTAVAHLKTRVTALEKPADAYITNYASCRLDTDAYIKAIKEKRIGAIVIDELTHVGNTESGTFRHINKIVNKTGIRHVYGATGSPADSPKMVFGMGCMINKDRMPCRTKGAWNNMVTYQYGPSPHMRAVSARAPEIIFNALQPAVRFRKEDILDLPPVVWQDRECELSGEQSKARASLKEDAVALLSSGDTITAANGGVLFTRMSQVAQGFGVSEDGKVVDLDHKDRTRVILEAIKEASSKAVVACFFTHTIQTLAKELKAAGLTVGIVDGSVTGLKRDQTLQAFQEEKDPHVLIVHPTTAAFGTELSAADTLIVNGPPPLGGFIWAQLLERLSSPKQQAEKISIIRIIGSPEEQRFFNILDKGKEMGSFVGNLFADYTRGVL